jgi:hypothetical protein
MLFIWKTQGQSGEHLDNTTNCNLEGLQYSLEAQIAGPVQGISMPQQSYSSQRNHFDFGDLYP